MKRTKHLLLATALFLLAGSGIFQTLRVRELETRLARIQVAQTDASSITYEFDESFVRYYGDEGLAEVKRALEDRKRLATP